MLFNFAAYVFAFLAYYAVGYAFQFGAVAINAAPVNLGGTPTLNHFLIGSGQWGFVGGKGFFFLGSALRRGQQLPGTFRGRLHGDGWIHYCGRDLRAHYVLGVPVCELFVGAILYPISGCWTWGGGWLSQLGSTMDLGHGYVDFAGFTVVHCVGGFCAMALAYHSGATAGEVRAGGKIRVFPAHNIV